MDQSAEKETESEESEQVSMVEAVVDRDVSEELQQPGSNNRLVRHLVCMGPLQNDKTVQTTLRKMTLFDEYSLDMFKPPGTAAGRPTGLEDRLCIPG